ncbi:hypothetical protein [Streptomyces lushanensis]|uniref:hypothetical protein n=1 Tax=Streptomyces lushanensis TaxID=1434255 RepID=UPI00082B9808|nr:hypothetical protein [Streptomyces lushanensis]
MTTLDEPDTLPSALLTFSCPLAPETSPEAEQLQHHTLTWAQKYDLRAGDARLTAKYALTAAAWSTHGTPNAADAHAVRSVSAGHGGHPSQAGRTVSRRNVRKKRRTPAREHRPMDRAPHPWQQHHRSLHPWQHYQAQHPWQQHPWQVPTSA